MKQRILIPVPQTIEKIVKSFNEPISNKITTRIRSVELDYSTQTIQEGDISITRHWFNLVNNTNI